MCLPHLLLQSLLIPVAIFGQAPPADVIAAIRKEENDNSKIMNTMFYFTDLYGPRLTGSPNHVNAEKWAADEMKKWGFDYTGLEPWDFGHPGWVNDYNTGVMLSPVADTLTYEVLAWTPSTKGKVSADVVSMVIPQFPAQENPTDHAKSDAGRADSLSRQRWHRRYRARSLSSENRPLSISQQTRHPSIFLMH